MADHTSRPKRCWTWWRVLLYILAMPWIIAYRIIEFSRSWKR